MKERKKSPINSFFLAIKWKRGQSWRHLRLQGFLISCHQVIPSSVYGNAHGGGWIFFIPARNSLFYRYVKSSVLCSIEKAAEYLFALVYYVPIQSRKRFVYSARAHELISFISNWLNRLSTGTVLLWLKFKWNFTSHFCVRTFFSAVTKVKGLTDLSEKAKVGERGEPTTKRNRGSATSNERPSSTNGRQTSIKVGKKLSGNYWQSLFVFYL